MTISLQNHWNKIYASKAVEELSWYEVVPEPCLRLLDRCQLRADDPILDAGAGASTFVDAIIKRGFRRVIAVDVSEIALSKLKERLGAEAERVEWITADITQPACLPGLEPIALWHDRAVLHFQIEEAQRQGYWATVRQIVRAGGYVIIAAFALNGATHCSGLAVQRYDAAQLAQLAGSEFELLETFDYTYTMPSGEARPYVYTLFRRGIST